MHVKGQQSNTNDFLLGELAHGKHSDQALVGVHIKNIAEAHVRSLDEKVKSTSFLVRGNIFTWKDAVDVAKKYYPNFKVKVEPVTEILVPTTDTSRVEEELGIKWTEPEIMIREVLDTFLQ